nr:hypothetical protein [Carnobacterium maltaromaticum]
MFILALTKLVVDVLKKDKKNNRLL